jgi:hypothetical protein
MSIKHTLKPFLALACLLAACGSPLVLVACLLTACGSGSPAVSAEDQQHVVQVILGSTRRMMCVN